MFYPESAQWYRKGKGDAYTASDKGHWKGSCNRSCCQAPHLALWWNQSTRAYYCVECARLINDGCSQAELERLHYDRAGLCVPISNPTHPHYMEDAPWGLELQKEVDTISGRAFRCMALMDDRRDMQEELRDWLNDPNKNVDSTALEQCVTFYVDAIYPRDRMLYLEGMSL